MSSCLFLFGQLNLQCTLVTRIVLHPLALVSVQSHAPTICIVSHMKYRWIDSTTLSYGPMGVMSSQTRRSKTGGPRKKMRGKQHSETRLRPVGFNIYIIPIRIPVHNSMIIVHLIDANKIPL